MRKKRYGALIGLILLNWLGIGLMVWKVDPEMVKNVLIPNSYLPMAALMFSGWFWLFLPLVGSAKKSIVWSLLVMIFVYLRLWGLGNIFNGLLLLGLGIMVVYFD